MRLTTQSFHKFRQDESALQGLGLLPRMLIAWLAGAVFLFALAPYYFWFIALVSPTVLYALLLAPMSNKQAFWIGEMYGMGLWSVGAFWLYTSIHTYGNTPAVLAVLMIGMVGIVMGLFHGMLAVCFNKYFAKQPFSFVSLWVIQEWLKTWVFTGFPWLFVGYAYTEQGWLNGLAPIFGVLAMTLVSVLLSASLVEAIRKRYQFLLLSLVLLISCAVLGYISPAWTSAKNTANPKISLIQGNIPQDLKWLTSYQLKTLEIYANLSKDEWGQDIVVWPEASIPMTQLDAWPFVSQIAKLAQDTKTSWITGIPYVDEQEFDSKIHAYPPFYNSVIALGADAVGLYKKQNLVPVGEYTPFEGLLNWALPDLMAGSISFSEGKANQSPLLAKNHRIGVAICYEVAYPDTTRKNAKHSDFLLTVSNDAWFGTSAGPLQHLQMVQMRALETGRWFVRATNTGVTAIINDKGQIVKQAPQFESTVLRGEVQARSGLTPFMQWGSYPVLLLVSVLLFISFFNKKPAPKKYR